MGVIIPPILFWPAAALLAGLCATMVLLFAARAAKRAGEAAEDPARTVYRRQLQDLDELVDRGVLAEGERTEAHAEAARRLLAEPATAPEEKGNRLWPLAAAALAALSALGLYVWLGSPGAADQPYRARLKGWEASPGSYAEVAAVLRERLKAHPDDLQTLATLGKVESLAGDPIAASQYLTRASVLEPGNADLQAMLGASLAAAAGNKPTPAAEAALNRALQIDPNNQAALFYLGGAKAADGDRAAATQLWRRLIAELPDSDVRKASLVAATAQLENGPPAPTAPAADTGEQAGFIRGMVASLQARLDSAPDDPAGWARLVRSYKVLGDRAAEDKALAKARSLFAKRPTDLAPIETAAQ